MTDLTSSDRKDEDNQFVNENISWFVQTCFMICCVGWNVGCNAG